jgi:peptidoglycan LD-endopeptidase LytH
MHYPLKNMKILSGSPGNAYGMVRRYKDGSAKPHQGWDLETRVGTPMYAVHDGAIEYVQKKDEGGYGRYILMSFDYQGKFYYAFYAHIEHNIVNRKDWVYEGDLIGYTGETGNAKGSAPSAEHLHFELRNRRYCPKGLTGRVDPAVLFGPAPYGGFSTDGYVPGTTSW